MRSRFATGRVVSDPFPVFLDLFFLRFAHWHWVGQNWGGQNLGVPCLREFACRAWKRVDDRTCHLAWGDRTLKIPPAENPIVPDPCPDDPLGPLGDPPFSEKDDSLSGEAHRLPH